MKSSGLVTARGCSALLHRLPRHQNTGRRNPFPCHGSGGAGGNRLEHAALGCHHRCRHPRLHHLGRLKAVAWLDSAQFVLYLAGGIITIAFISLQLEGGLTSALSTLSDSGKLHVISFAGDVLTNPMSFWGAFLGGLFLSLGSHGVDYMMVQRVLGCSSLSAARKALIGSGFFRLSPVRNFPSCRLAYVPVRRRCARSQRP